MGCFRVLETHRRSDLARVDGLYLFALISLEAHDASQAFLASRSRVVDVRTGLDRTRVDAKEGQLSDERIRLQLEGERAEGFLVGGVALDFTSSFRIDAFDRGHLKRRGKIVDDRVEHELHALVLERRTRIDGEDFVRDDRSAERRLEFLHSRLLSVEIVGHELFVMLDDGLDEFRAVEIRVALMVLRNVELDHLLPHSALEAIGLHLKEVYDTLELLLRADRKLHTNRTLRESIENGLERLLEGG